MKCDDYQEAKLEHVWQRKTFFEGSPETPLPKAPGTYTALSVSVRVPLAIDLTEPPMSSDAAHGTDPDDYSSCLDLVDRVRGDGCEIIRYASVRHPMAGKTLRGLPAKLSKTQTPFNSRHGT